MTYRSVSEALSVVSSVERTWDQMYGGFEPLLRKNPSVSTAKLQQVLAKLANRPLSSFIQIGDDVLTGIVRNALGSSRANIVLAKQILVSRNAASNLSVVFSLVDTAKGVLRQLGTLATSVRTLEDWTSSGRSSSLVRINGLGIEPFTVFAVVVLVAGIVWFVVGVSILIDTMQRSQNAEIARENANIMCERAAASGNPCTPEDWQANYEEAAAAQQEISPTILGPHGGADPLQSISDLILWGGLIAVVAGVGYTILNRERERRHVPLIGMKMYRLVGPCGGPRAVDTIGRVSVKDCGMFETVDEAKEWVSDFAEQAGMRKIPWKSRRGGHAKDMLPCNEFVGGAETEPYKPDHSNWKTYVNFTITDCNHAGKPYRSLNGSV